MRCIADAEKAIKARVQLPPGYYYNWSGQFENEVRAKKRLQIVMPIAIGIIYILLYLTYRSFLEAAHVLLAVPFALTGGLYLLWLGYKALASRDLISFQPSARQPLRKVFLTGLLSNVLNPKPGLFVLAFLPQFVSAGRGSVTVQMLVYGAIFAVMTAIIFSILGSMASQLSAWLQRHPRFGTGLNVGAGLTFIASGLSVLALKQRS